MADSQHTTPRALNGEASTPSRRSLVAGAPVALAAIGLADSSAMAGPSDKTVLAGAGEKGPYFLSVKHPGAARELAVPSAAPFCSGHVAAFVLDSEMALREAIATVYRLSLALPTLPLETFLNLTAGLGATEADRVQKVRIGQDVFRAALMDYWDRACPLTGITDEALSRASHLRPWAECDTDAQRLDAHNGLLLSSLWDAAFDAGLVTFDDYGSVVASAWLTPKARDQLSIETVSPLKLRPEHLVYLAHHRASVWKSDGP